MVCSRLKLLPVSDAQTLVRTLMASLESIAGLADQKQKVEQYRSLLGSLVAASDVEGLKGLTDHSALHKFISTV